MPATGDGVGIVRLGNALTGQSTGAENILSAETDADGWYIGKLPGFSKEIAVRHVLNDGGWWEARVGTESRPHKYLDKEAAQQGALAEVQRLRIAGID
jgi:hypothetical protein